MNLEREAMKGKLVDAQTREKQLALRIEGCARALRTGLNTALTPLVDLAVPELDEQWDALKEAWAKLHATRSEISRLERELK